MSKEHSSTDEFPHTIFGYLTHTITERKLIQQFQDNTHLTLSGRWASFTATFLKLAENRSVKEDLHIPDALLRSVPRASSYSFYTAPH